MTKEKLEDGGIKFKDGELAYYQFTKKPICPHCDKEQKTGKLRNLLSRAGSVFFTNCKDCAKEFCFEETERDKWTTWRAYSNPGKYGHF